MAWRGSVFLFVLVVLVYMCMPRRQFYNLSYCYFSIICQNVYTL